MSNLAILLHGEQVATTWRTRNGTLRLGYLPHIGPHSTPLSLSLPPARVSFSGGAVERYLWSLLPENDDALRWVQRLYGADPRDPLSLLAAIGKDCAGAVQFCAPEEIESVRCREGRLDPADDIEHRLAQIRLTDDSSWQMPGEHWSLNGTQQKFTLFDDAGTWFYARGSLPSTHIVKPGVRDVRHQALIEHLSMRAAELLGLSVPHSSYVDFGAERAIVVERFDRRREGTRVARLHQEDFCQALGIEEKYEDRGGPGVPTLVTLLRERSATARSAEENVKDLLDAIVYNALIAAPDAHARNFAIVLDADRVTVAPMYDVATGLAYEPVPGRGRVSSLSIGGTFDLDALDRDSWRRLGDAARFDGEWIAERADELLQGLSEAFRAAAEGVDDWDSSVSKVMARITPALERRVARLT